jgi:hypothetical protein
VAFAELLRVTELPWHIVAELGDIDPAVAVLSNTVTLTGEDAAAGQTPFFLTALTYRTLAPFKPDVQLYGFVVPHEPDQVPPVPFH